MSNIESFGDGLMIKNVDPRIELARVVFNPHQPVSDRELFSGRVSQLDQTIGAIRTPGKHPIVFGFRGVGKTSLANIVRLIASSDGCVVLPYKCNSGSTFRSIIRGALGDVAVPREKTVTGFGRASEVENTKLIDYISEKFEQSDIAKLFSKFGANAVLLIDELDRVTESERSKLADLIKIVSDDPDCPLTIVLVGVAETLDDLIKAHPSVERNISEVHMTLMKEDEVSELIRRGAKKLSIDFEKEVVDSIVYCAQGFPYFAHLIAQHASIEALNEGKSVVDKAIFDLALTKSLSEVDQTIKRAYREAVQANRKTLFPEVLLAAAQAESDEFGFFTAKEISSSPVRDDGSSLSLQALQYPLSKLTQEGRGSILLKKGEPKRFRYRFANPMMRQYVLMLKMSKKDDDV